MVAVKRPFNLYILGRDCKLLVIACRAARKLIVFVVGACNFGRIGIGGNMVAVYGDVKENFCSVYIGIPEYGLLRQTCIHERKRIVIYLGRFNLLSLDSKREFIA